MAASVEEPASRPRSEAWRCPESLQPQVPSANQPSADAATAPVPCFTSTFCKALRVASNLLFPCAVEPGRAVVAGAQPAARTTATMTATPPNITRAGADEKRTHERMRRLGWERRPDQHRREASRRFEHFIRPVGRARIACRRARLELSMKRFSGMRDRARMRPVSARRSA
jgi:hypothetical protein